jgi:hypothetical protein
MIYIIVGTDRKKINSIVSGIVKDRGKLSLEAHALSKERLLDFARSTSLFGETPALVVEDIISGGEISFSKEDLIILNEAETVFIFIESKLLKANENAFKKYASIERIEDVKEKKVPATNTFAIADAFGRFDKVSTWVLYRDAIEKGAEPEAISGMLFWKIKQMVLSGARGDIVERLRHMSADLVSLYHRAHRGECDFVVGLEQFILASLSK